MEKYYFNPKKNEIICVKQYHGKNYRGVARCAPEDEFNEDFGRDLAGVRCDEKILKAKLKYYEEEISEAKSWISHFEKKLNKLVDKRTELLCDFIELRDLKADYLS